MAYSVNNLVEIINKNRDKKVAVSKIIDTTPQTLTTLPKLIKDKSNIAPGKKDVVLDRGMLEAIHTRIETNKNNNKSIIKLFPDIELSIQILVSSILSPKKMTDIQLNYKIDKKLELTPELTAGVLDIIKEYIQDEHDLETKLPEIVREALFNSGAYCFAIIPESSVDDVINSDLISTYTAESFKEKADAIIDKFTKPLNLKDSNEQVNLNQTKPSMKNIANYLASSSFVKTTDNYGILKFNEIKENISSKLIKNSLRKGLAVAAESQEKIQYLDIFRDRGATYTKGNTLSVKTKLETKRKNIDKPMVVKLPSESTIPVCVPGDESNHIGYLVLLDEFGKPLGIESPDNTPASLNTLYSQNNLAQSTPIQTAFRNLVNDTNAPIDINQLFSMYKDILENQIYTNIKNSLYGNNIEISNRNEIYYLMFTRALGEQKTSILFIPKDLMVYFAFYYNEYGVGKSLLDNLSILTSLRAILLFSKVMAQSKQAIDVTKVNISLDPRDPDPEKTISQVQDMVLKLRQNFFPLGINNPVDLVNWIQRAGLQFQYENNPLLPDVKINFENANLDHTVPNSELEDDLRKQTIQALGLSPETVDSGFSPEFATTIVNNNILLSKRVILYQKTLEKHLSKFLEVVIYNDEVIRNKLKNFIEEKINDIVAILDEKDKQQASTDKENFVDNYIDRISEAVYIEFPKPENTNLANLSTEFKLYKENLEEIVDSIISEELFSEDMVGEISTKIPVIKNIFKHYLLREWCSTNNYYPEALELTDSTELSVDTLLDNVSTQLTSTMKNGTLLYKIMKKFKDATNHDLSTLGDNNSSDSTTTSTEPDEGSGSDSEGSEGDGEDGLNFNF